MPTTERRRKAEGRGGDAYAKDASVDVKNQGRDEQAASGTEGTCALVFPWRCKETGVRGALW